MLVGPDCDASEMSGLVRELAKARALLRECYLEVVVVVAVGDSPDKLRTSVVDTSSVPSD